MYLILQDFSDYGVFWFDDQAKFPFVNSSDRVYLLVEQTHVKSYRNLRKKGKNNNVGTKFDFVYHKLNITYWLTNEVRNLYCLV